MCAVIFACAEVRLLGELQQRRPRDLRLNYEMPWLVWGVSMLKAPDLNLSEQRERRLFPMRIAQHHFKESLTNGVAPQRRKRVRAPGGSVRTMFEKSILHRPHKFVGNARTVVAKDAESLHAIIFAVELAKHFCQKHALRVWQIAVRE